MLRLSFLLAGGLLIGILPISAQPTDLAEAEARAHAATPYKADEIMGAPATKLAAILTDDNATVFEKAKACQRLAVIGERKSVSALAGLLSDPRLSHYARTALETIPDPSADEALVAALDRLDGDLLIGAINSLGRRKYPGSMDALSRLRRSERRDIAEAASAALTKLRSP